MPLTVPPPPTGPDSEPDVAGRAWTVGLAPAPGLVEPAAARARRLEARLAVYAQYAALTAERAAALVTGDGGRDATLAMEQADAAEHFDELRTSPPAVAPAAFAEALTDAVSELAHQNAIDDALQQRLNGLRAAAHGAAARLAPPGRSRLDVRF